MKYFLIILAALFAPLTVAAPAWAGSDAVYTSWKDNVAVGGYDAVSYFSGKPVEGSPQYSFAYNGADWQFATQANRDLFAANPEAFAPQYGGYCAWAISQNKLAKGSPKHWHIEDGKLYLNYNKRIQKRWESDISGFVQTAETNWPTVLEK